MQCLTIAVENPPAPGEYRVFNQFEEVYDITELAGKVGRVARDRSGSRPRYGISKTRGKSRGPLL